MLSVYHGKQRKGKERNFLLVKGYKNLMLVVFKFFSAHVIVFLTSCFHFFFFFRGFFPISLLKYFYVEQKQAPGGVL